jgi:hypothetical protein
MPKPTEVLQWMIDHILPDEDLPEVPAGQQAAGWTEDDVPPAGWWNRILRISSLWQAYLRDLEGYDHTWTGQNAFTNENVAVAEVLRLGVTPGGEEEDTLTAPSQRRIEVDAVEGDGTATSKTYVMGFGTGAQGVQLWIDRGFHLEIVTNATWNISTKKWNKHVNGADAHLFRLGPEGPVLAVKDASEDTAWGNTLDSSSGWTKATLSYGLGAQVIPTLIVATISAGFAASTAVVSTLSWAGTLSAALARLSFARHATEPRTRIARFSGTNHAVNVYYGNGSGFGEVLELAFNATWNVSSDNWEADSNTATPATLVQISKDGIDVLTKAATTGTWTHASWTQGWPLVNWLSGLVASSLGVDSLTTNLATKISLLKAILFTSTPSATRTLVGTLQGDSYAVQIYRSASGEGLEIAHNCTWDESASTWSANDDGLAASLWIIRRGDFRVYRRNTTVGSWADDAAGWSQGFPVFKADFTSKNPSATTGFTNTVTAKNVAKALARADNDSTACTQVDGFNAIIGRGAGDEFTVTFVDDMQNAAYFPTITVWSRKTPTPHAFGLTYRITNIDDGSISFVVINASDGSTVPNTDDLGLSVEVTGAQ